MKFWKRILRSLLRALLFGGIGLLLFTARGYYLDYQEFREYTNYKFASVADFFYQLNEKNEDMEILVDYAKRETVTLRELLPKWWGAERYEQAR